MPSRLGDYIVVKKKHAGPTKVYRGDMSADEWEAEITKAEKAGVLVANVIDGNALAEAQTNYIDGDALIREKEKDLTRFGPGKPGGAVPAIVKPRNLDLERAEDEAGLPRGTIRPASVAEKGSEVASTVQPARVERSTGTPDVRPAQVDRSATADLSPEEWARQKADMARQAEVESVRLQNQAVLDNAINTATNIGKLPGALLMRYFGPEAIPITSDIASGMGMLAEKAGEVFGGGPTGQRVPVTPPAEQGVPPLLARPPEQPMLPDPNLPNGGLPTGTPVSTKTSVSASVKGGGGGSFADLEKQSQEIAKRTEQALTAQAEAEARGLQNTADIRAQAIHDDLMRQADYERTQRDMQERVNTQMSKYQEAVDAFKQMANEKIDPNRFWNNKSTGQKISAAIAGAMFGFTGQGMQWLQRIDGLVEQDIRAQSADLANKREALGAVMTGQQNLVNMARQAGMDGLAAINTARSMAWANVEEQLKLVADNTSSDLVRTNALKGVAVAQQKQAEFALKVRAEQQENAARWAAINIQRQAAAAKANAPGKQREVSPTLIKQYTTTLNMIESLKKMRELAKSSGFGRRMWRGVEEVLTDEENAKKKQYEALQFQIARDRAGSSLQKPEQEALLPLLTARSGYYDPVPAIDQAIDMATKHLSNEVMGIQSGTSGDLTPVVEKLKSLEAESAGNSVGFTE